MENVQSTAGNTDAKILDFTRQDFLSHRDASLKGVSQNSENLLKLCIQMNVLALTGWAAFYGLNHATVNSVAIGICSSIHIISLSFLVVLLWNAIRIGNDAISFLTKFHPGSLHKMNAPSALIAEENTKLANRAQFQEGLILAAVILFLISLPVSFFTIIHLI